MFDPKFLPTPQEIEDAKSLIQTRWTPCDRRNRMCGGQVVPVVYVGDRIVRERPLIRGGVTPGNKSRD